ncbi:hypothetical protein [Rhodomicrobium lacus]|uniref:hypothetical protein n=1 Tax=Rhodomicrobium lacus TaxID=2498452 RepID=UPI000F8F02E2|nr:hypothetical protein [Rhodomicrobium lacus]
MWIVFAWVVFCWIVGTFTRTLVGVGLFFAPIVGLITFSITERAEAGWLAAGLTVFIPVGFHIDKKEKYEAELKAKERERNEAEIAREMEKKKRLQIQADVDEAYNVLTKLSGSEEARQLCQDYIDFYCNDIMELETKKAFETKITEFARPHIEAIKLKQLEEEERRWQEEERQEQLRLAEIKAKNAILRKRYIDNT